MPAIDEVNAATRQLLGDAERVLGASDDLLAHASDELAKLRREHASAKRAVGSLSEGTGAMRAIGQTIADQLGSLADGVESSADTVAATRTLRRRIAKAVELLRAALDQAPPPNAALVRPMVERLVNENGGLTYEDAYGLVRDKLASEGVPQIGLGLHVRRALIDLPLEADDDGVYRPVNGAKLAPLRPIAVPPSKAPATEGAR